MHLRKRQDHLADQLALRRGQLQKRIEGIALQVTHAVPAMLPLLNAAAHALAIAQHLGRHLERIGQHDQLALPAAVLLGAVLISSGFCLLGQNWLHTVIFGAYTGFAYTGYLGAVAAMLADVAFNRTRVTTAILNAASQVIGSASGSLDCPTRRPISD